MIKLLMNMQWLLPIMQNIPTTSHYAEHSHSFPPQCFISKSPWYQKKMIPFLCMGLFLYPPFFLSPLHPPRNMSLLSLLLNAILPPFPSLTTIGCPKFFSFTLSWSSPFSLFIIFHSTNKHLEITSLLHTNPLKTEKGLRLN